MVSLSNFKQAERLLKLATPLGEDTLLVQGAVVRERLSALFEIELDLLSTDDTVDPNALLGQPATLEFDLGDEGQRYFNGCFSRFTHIGYQERLARYKATLVPWLWFLSRTSDCRIFQEKKVPDIIEEVFREAGFTDYENRLTAEYRLWEYCVQYRETDFNFVSRLMENEGIYWYFLHEDGRHVLILADAYSAHQPFPGYDRIQFHGADQDSKRDQEFIFDWSFSASVRAGAFVHDDFDFKKPTAELRTTDTLTRSHAHADHEIYDYPGNYVTVPEGERYAGVRMEELQADHQIFRGEGYARGLAVGALFALTDYPRADQNREYLVLSAEHHLQSDEFLSTEALADWVLYRSSFGVMDSSEPFRPARVTPKPSVKGPQTAIVVGRSGEEIDTDEYARVKVQFHWDRYGEMNENSSCWIRVSQLWAGDQWGGIHIPRIGQEVIVDFLEGDPDRPIITGRVYNADCMPPYRLPANKTQSGIKSRSTKGGGPENFNEFRFEDKKGHEEVYLHAERNLTSVVEANERRTVSGKRETEIHDNELLTIVQGSRTEIIERGDDSLGIQRGDREVQLGEGDDRLLVRLGDIEIEAPAGTFSVSANGVEIKGTTSVKILCGASSIEMTPGSISLQSASIEINGAMVKINS